MSKRARPLYGAIGALTGLAYLILALVGATGIAWVIPAVCAAVAFGVANSVARAER